MLSFYLAVALSTSPTSCPIGYSSDFIVDPRNLPAQYTPERLITNGSATEIYSSIDIDWGNEPQIEELINTPIEQSGQITNIHRAALNLLCFNGASDNDVEKLIQYVTNGLEVSTLSPTGAAYLNILLLEMKVAIGKQVEISIFENEIQVLELAQVTKNNAILAGKLIEFNMKISDNIRDNDYTSFIINLEGYVSLYLELRNFYKNEISPHVFRLTNYQFNNHYIGTFASYYSHINMINIIAARINYLQEHPVTQGEAHILSRIVGNERPIENMGIARPNSEELTAIDQIQYIYTDFISNLHINRVFIFNSFEESPFYWALNQHAAYNVLNSLNDLSSPIRGDLDTENVSCATERRLELARSVFGTRINADGNNYCEIRLNDRDLIRYNDD